MRITSDSPKNKPSAHSFVPLWAQVVGLAGTIFCASPALAAPILGPDLASFAVLGATTVTNVPTSTIVGNVGVSPGSAITGFSPAVPGVPTVDATGQVTGGLLHAATAQAAQAQLDLTAARTTLGFGAGGLASLNGTFTPGTYDFGAGLLGAGETITLDGLGSSNAVWIFRFTSSLTTVQGSSFNLTNVGNGSGVGIYWNAVSSATLDGDTFAGNVFAGTLISSNGNLTLGCGRLASDTAAVTLIQDTISIGCNGVGSGSNGFDQGNNGEVPEPATLALLGLGLAAIGVIRRRRDEA